MEMRFWAFDEAAYHQLMHLLRIFGNTTLKRSFDIAVSLTLLIMLAPLLIVLTILIRTRLGSPILFHQERSGLYGKPFIIHKFRTMTDARDEHGELLPDEQRLPRFGQLLRSTSLDELPELLNVLQGNMSLVGSRPLLMEYLPLYNQEQARRHDVLPGITGWAQVNGRNQISWEEKFELDVWYVDNRSFLLDIKILFLTAYKALKREGINAEGYTTSPMFRGSAQNTLAESAR